MTQFKVSNLNRCAYQVHFWKSICRKIALRSDEEIGVRPNSNFLVLEIEKSGISPLLRLSSFFAIFLNNFGKIDTTLKWLKKGNKLLSEIFTPSFSFRND